MSYPWLRYIVIVTLATTLVWVAGAHARPVELSDARVPPTVLAYVGPHDSITFASENDGYNCPASNAWFSEVSAYRWNGGALGDQHRSAFLDWWVRPGHPHQRVTFDGITFRNHTRIPVLVAGWCE